VESDRALVWSGERSERGRAVDPTKDGGRSSCVVLDMEFREEATPNFACGMPRERSIKELFLSQDFPLIFTGLKAVALLKSFTSRQGLAIWMRLRGDGGL